MVGSDAVGFGVDRAAAGGTWPLSRSVDTTIPRPMVHFSSRCNLTG